MKQAAVLLIIVFVIKVIIAGKLPPEFKRCKRGDKDLSKCLKVAIEEALPRLSNGIQNLHIPPLQPLFVPRITNGEGKGSIVLVYRNYKLYGLPTTKIKTMEAKLESDAFDAKMEAFSPEIRTEAEYTATGTSLTIPVNGHGNCTVTLENVKTTVSIHAKMFKKKEKKYLKVEEFNLNIIPEKVVFDFENIVNRNEQLSRELNKVLNENWKAVYSDVEHDFNIALQTVFQDYANRIFTQVPYDDLFLV